MRLPSGCPQPTRGKSGVCAQICPADNSSVQLLDPLAAFPLTYYFLIFQIVYINRYNIL